ncbi:MAG: hypothetical protein PHF38_08600 [Bacteroidales bacterium]|nr:hypothetical protein [Bacteroidales bacterium]MDD4361911.1 hypothetical protein [Bacteroidales bacterium]
MKATHSRRVFGLAILLVALSSGTPASEKSKESLEKSKERIELCPTVDLVSSYIWRGAYQTGISLQPGLSATYSGFFMSAWGSTDFSTSFKEFDLSLGYENRGFSLIINDYWWAGEGNPYFDYRNLHYYEAGIGYSFGEKFPLSLSWNTFWDKDASTYIQAAYDFSLSDVGLNLAVGLSPWTGYYHKTGTNGFIIADVVLTASKSIPISPNFALPVFTQLIVAPNQNNVYFVFGLSL